MKTRYEIPEPNLIELTEEIEKLMHKAQKLNSAPITFEVVDTKEEINDGKVYKWLIVEISGESPMLNGWKFAAKLEHMPEGNIIRSLVDFDLPKRFRTIEPRCEYCKTKRNRVNTYVVYNDYSEFYQVGSSCLKDFTGHTNPHAIAKWLSVLSEINETCKKSEDYDPDTNYGGSSAIRLEIYLAYAAMSIRDHGYVKTNDGGVLYDSTKDDALGKMFTRRNKLLPSDKDLEIAESTVKHIRSVIANKANPSDYEWNLVTIFANNYVDFRSCGYVASAVIVYLKYQEQQARNKAEFGNSQLVGQIKKRQVFQNLTCIGIHYFENAYGTTKLHKFTDEQGNYLVWFSSNKELEIGKVYTGKATVKNHKAYKGINQTILTRCAFQSVR